MNFLIHVSAQSSEVWGVYNSDDIERIHLKFCKRILNVRSNTCTAGVYGELGRYPLFITRYIRIIKYWFKLLTTDNIILRTVYNQALNDCNQGQNNWVKKVKRMGFPMFSITRVIRITLFSLMYLNKER